MSPSAECRIRTQGLYSLTVLTWDLTQDLAWTRDVSHDVSIISRCCLVCVTFFHSKSMATTVTSSRIHTINIAFHGCARTWIRDGDNKNDRPCSQCNIFEHRQPMQIYSFEKTCHCQHIDFVSVTVISCICQTNTSLVVIFKGESLCKSPSSWAVPWLTPRLGHELRLVSRIVSEYESWPKSWLKSKLKTRDFLRPLVNTAPGSQTPNHQRTWDDVLLEIIWKNNSITACNNEFNATFPKSFDNQTSNIRFLTVTQSHLISGGKYAVKHSFLLALCHCYRKLWWVRIDDFCTMHICHLPGDP